ncbi:retrovirus-related pol polyprotein from transposon TNT 1-94 [Tanacetum coccineum]
MGVIVTDASWSTKTKKSKKSIGKSKESNKEVFTVYLHYDGLFITSPLTYAEGSRREINDINFDGMSLDILCEIVKKLVPATTTLKRLYYCKTGTPLPLGIKECNSDNDVRAMLKARAVFRGSTSRQQVDDIPEEDPQNDEIDVVFKIKKGIWYMNNDWRSVLVFCGKNPDEGRCAGMKGNKNRKMSVIDSGEGSSNQVNRSKVKKVKKVKKSNKGVQVKNMILRSSVNAQNPSGEDAIIANPFISYNKMKADIRQKFMIDVSLGQCRRAKQRALFDHEGGLIEHYSRLYDYRQAILDSNPGSTCRLDVVQDNASPTFKRIYFCFKGVKDGWLAGCRKVIGLDGCFLKHTCKGELLTAMGRDANNQMYPIAWAVVRVENSENWMWFLSLLQDDLSLNDGTGITIISDSHKGLLDAVHEFLPQAEHRKCTRHIFANFKKKFSGVQLQSLFGWFRKQSGLEEIVVGVYEEVGSSGTDPVNNEKVMEQGRVAEQLGGGKIWKERSKEEEDYARRCRDEEEWEAQDGLDTSMHWMRWLRGLKEGEGYYVAANEDVTANEDVKGKAPVDEGSNVAATPSKKRNRQKWRDQSYVDGFDQFGTGSTPEKAFDISESD